MHASWFCWIHHGTLRISRAAWIGILIRQIKVYTGPFSSILSHYKTNHTSFEESSRAKKSLRTIDTYFWSYLPSRSRIGGSKKYPKEIVEKTKNVKNVIIYHMSGPQNNFSHFWPIFDHFYPISPAIFAPEQKFAIDHFRDPTILDQLGK